MNSARRRLKPATTFTGQVSRGVHLKLTTFEFQVSRGSHLKLTWRRQRAGNETDKRAEAWDEETGNKRAAINVLSTSFQRPFNVLYHPSPNVAAADRAAALEKRKLNDEEQLRIHGDGGVDAGGVLGIPLPAPGTSYASPFNVLYLPSR